MAIRREAMRTGMDMSVNVPGRLPPAPAAALQQAIAALNGPAKPAYALAEINSLLSGLTTGELRQAVAEAPEAPLSPFLANYVAAMVEAACSVHGVPLPAWTRTVAPLEEPVFGSTLPSLRLYLLTHSPAPFRRRNLFIDSSIGARV